MTQGEGDAAGRPGHGAPWAAIEHAVTLDELAALLGVARPAAVALVDQAGISLRRARGRGAWLVRPAAVHATLARQHGAT
jgi:hypothetical protein